MTNHPAFQIIVGFGAVILLGLLFGMIAGPGVVDLDYCNSGRYTTC